MSRANLKTILLIEDEMVIALAQAQTIERFGYTVLTANSGEEGIRIALRDENVNLVLMDIDLGTGVDGPEAARRILDKRNLPIVFLTSHSERGMVEKVQDMTRYGLVIKNSGDFVLQSSIEMAFELFEAHQDIEKRMKALRESEERLNDVAGQRRTVTWEVDPEGLYTYCSAVSQSVFGYGAKTIVGKKYFYDLHPLAGRQAFKEAAFAVFSRKEHFRNLEHIVQGADGQLVWVSTSALPIVDGGGALLGYRGSDIDITDRKRIEGELNESENLYRLIFEKSGEAILLTKPDGTIHSANPAACRLFGKSESEIKAGGRNGVIDPNDPRLPKALEQRRKEGTFNGELNLLKPDGSSFPGDISSTLWLTPRGEERTTMFIRDISERKRAEGEINTLSRFPAENPNPILRVEGDGKIIYTNHASESLLNLWNCKKGEYVPPEVQNMIASAVSRGTTTTMDVTCMTQFYSIAVVPIPGTGYVNIYGVDITERKRFEERLEQSVSLLQATLESTADGILVVDTSGRISSYNTQFATMWNLLPEVVDSRDDDLVMSQVLGQMKDPDFSTSKVKEIYSRPDESTFSVIELKDGKIFEHHSIPQRVDGKPVGRVWSFRDVTARKKAERRITLLAHTVASVTDCVSITDLEERFIFVNSAFLQTYGYASEELMGQPVSIIRSANSSPEIGMEILPGTLSGGWYGEVLNCRKDGSEFPVELWTSAVKDDTGTVIALVGVGRDISGRKLAESRKEAATEELHEAMKDMREMNLLLEEARTRADAMAVRAESASTAKSQFLANMSHEIRTPMNGVIGMTGLLLDSDLSPEQRQHAEIVRTSGEALMALINDILDFSKIEAGKLDIEVLDFDLRATMEETAELLAIAAQGKGLELVCMIEPKVPLLLRGDPGRLRQILINLGGNAVKFTHQGEITLRASLEAEDGGQTTVRFSVTDTGIGIPSEKQVNLFTPFIQVDGSTSRKYGGTGLGLAIARQLVELMHGAIGVESPLTPFTAGGEAAGSTFWFTAVFEKQTAEQIPEPTPTADLTGVRMLVVDDNETNRLLVVALLKQWGCRFAEAADGETALDRLREASRAGDPHSVVLIDMLMPGMTGAELGRRIKESTELRDTRLIMMTSLGGQGDRTGLSDLDIAGYLTKPLRQLQLRECLETASGRTKPAPAMPAQVLLPGSPEPGSQKRRGRILLAEDNPINQLVAMKILKKLGYRADAVGDGGEAIKALETISYDLVLMDCQMPEMDGFEATRAIRKMNIAIPIVALTANAMKGDRELCLDSGMNDYLSKPVKSAELAAALERWLPPSEQR